MKIYTIPQSFERTSLTIRRAKELSATIVCNTYDEVENYKYDANFYGVSIPTPITVADLKLGMRPGRIIIADLDAFLENMLDATVPEVFRAG